MPGEFGSQDLPLLPTADATPLSLQGANNSADVTSVSDALRKNRELQAALEHALSEASHASDANLIQKKALCQAAKARFFVGSTRLRRSSFFSILLPGNARPTLPTKNSDAVRKHLFANEHLRCMKTTQTRRWLKHEDKALLETIENRLREEQFHDIYQDLLSKDDVGEKNHKAFDTALVQVENVGLSELWERRHKVNWNCISKRLAKLQIYRDARACYVRFTQRTNPDLKSGLFKIEEDKGLLALATQHHGFDWDTVAFRMGGTRPAFRCFARYQRALNAQLISKYWTVPEIRRLAVLKQQMNSRESMMALGARFGDGKNPGQIKVQISVGLGFGPRRKMSDTKCRGFELLREVYEKGWSSIRRQLQLRDPHCRRIPLDRISRVKAPWHPEDDENLVQAIEAHGVGNWPRILQHFPDIPRSRVYRRFQSLNPDGIADVYSILLATKKKMLPSWSHFGPPREKRLSELLASDFNIHLYKDTGPRGEILRTITTGDKRLDRHLTRLNGMKISGEKEVNEEHPKSKRRRRKRTKAPDSEQYFEQDLEQRDGHDDDAPLLAAA